MAELLEKRVSHCSSLELLGNSRWRKFAGLFCQSCASGITQEGHNNVFFRGFHRVCGRPFSLTFKTVPDGDDKEAKQRCVNLGPNLEDLHSWDLILNTLEPFLEEWGGDQKKRCMPPFFTPCLE